MNRLRVFHGIDLVRTLSFFCIATYHCYSAFIFIRYLPGAWVGTPMFLIHAIPRAFPFSGFTIVAIYAFLAGLKNRPISLRRPFLVVVPGLILLFLFYSDFSRKEFFWEWDIYHFLLLALLSLAWLTRSEKLTYVFGAIGALLMLFPLWDWIPASLFPTGLAHALVGICDSEGKGGWFLLPWIGLPWIYLAMGRLLLRSPKCSRQELAIWSIPLLLGVFTWGRYFSVDIGPGFYCFMFRQPPYVFWGHFLWVSFALRLSVDPRVQSKLGAIGLVQWISRLEINRHFGLVYLLQLCLLGFAVSWILPLAGPRPTFYGMFLMLLPMSELAARGLLWGIRRLPLRKA